VTKKNKHFITLATGGMPPPPPTAAQQKVMQQQAAYGLPPQPNVLPPPPAMPNGPNMNGPSAYLVRTSYLAALAALLSGLG